MSDLDPKTAGDILLKLADKIPTGANYKAEVESLRDENAKLKAELDRIKGWCDHWKGCNDIAVRENNKLRAERDAMEQRKDDAYLERNRVVTALARVFPSGLAKTAIEGWSDDWHGCVYIDLPTGQVSWHYHDSQAHLFDGLPKYTGAWDGHTTEQKYERLAALRIERDALARAVADAEVALDYMSYYVWSNKYEARGAAAMERFRNRNKPQQQEQQP